MKNLNSFNVRHPGQNVSSYNDNVSYQKTHCDGDPTGSLDIIHFFFFQQTLLISAFIRTTMQQSLTRLDKVKVRQHWFPLAEAIISFEKNLISRVFCLRRWNWTMVTSSGHSMLMLAAVCKVHPEAYFSLWNVKSRPSSRLGQNQEAHQAIPGGSGTIQAVDSQIHFSPEWVRKLISCFGPVLGRAVKRLQLLPLWFQRGAAAVPHCFSKWHHCAPPSVCSPAGWDSKWLFTAEGRNTSKGHSPSLLDIVSIAKQTGLFFSKGKLLLSQKHLTTQHIWDKLSGWKCFQAKQTETAWMLWPCLIPGAIIQRSCW